MTDGYTEFGFNWGPMSVTRCCKLPTSYVVQIKTAHQEIDVYVSRAGRKIRVFGRDGVNQRGEWKPTEGSEREEGR